MTALSALWEEPFTPTVMGSEEERCPWEDVRMLIWGKGSRRSVSGPREGSPKAGVCQLGVFFPCQGALAMPGDIFYCHNWGRGTTGIWWAEVRTHDSPSQQSSIHPTVS